MITVVCTVCETPAVQGALGYGCRNEICENVYDFKQMNTEIATSIFIECRLWHDKAWGNTYFSNRIWVDGIIWDIQEMTYGYEFAYNAAAIELLIDAGKLTAEQSTVYNIREDGIHFYFATQYVKKSQMFKKENNA